jgi:hypothetical protein
MEPETHRKRPWWSRWLWLIILLAGCGGLYLWYYLQQRSELAALAAAEAEWDQQGIWRWDDWVASRPQLPDDENAALLIDKMAALIPKGLEDEDFEFQNIYLFRDVHLFPNCLYHPEQIQVERDRVSKCKEALISTPGLITARHTVWPKSLSSTGLPLFGRGPLPNIQKVRELVNVYGDHLEVQLYDKNIAGAMESVRAINKLMHSMDYEQAFLGRLVADAIVAVNCKHIERLLAMSEPDDAMLAGLQSELAPFNSYIGWQAALRVATGIGSQTFYDLRSGRLDSAAMARLRGDNPPSSWWEQLVSSVQTRFAASPFRQTEYLQTMLKCYRMSDQPWSVQRKAWDELEREFKSTTKSPSWNTNFALLILPALSKVGAAEMKIISAVRATQVALAAERFRRATGHWPKSQDQLVPTFLKAPLLDPFDDQPIRIRQLDDGLVVYSIGPDNNDDGGNVLDTVDSRAKDVGIRLWNPDNRRQPAQPLPPEYVQKKKEWEEAKDKKDEKKDN